MLVIYQDKIQLRLKAGCCLLIWRNELVCKVSVGRRSAVGDIPADELGGIGHETQLQAAVGLLVWVMISKYQDHLPLYRLEQIAARHHVNLSCTTLAEWVGRVIYPDRNFYVSD